MRPLTAEEKAQSKAAKQPSKELISSYKPNASEA